MSDEPRLAYVITWRRHGVRHVAFFGAIEVGDVMPWPWRRGGMNAAWRIFLPDMPKGHTAARDIATARSTVEERLAHWIDAAGLAPAARRSAPLRATVGGLLAPPESAKLAEKYAVTP